MSDERPRTFTEYGLISGFDWPTHLGKSGLRREGVGIVGGLGSGGANRKRAHLEGCRRISVRYLRRHGLMQPSVHANLSWNDNCGRPTGTIQVVGGRDLVTLVYSVRRDDADEWRPIEERVALARVQKPFGGKQTYLVCPRCRRRVMELALGRERFRCRTCVGVVHASSQESLTDRAMRQANKLKRRLGVEPGLDSWYQRPKHMRRKTFEKIDARIQAAESEVNDAHIRLLARLGRLDARTKGKCAGGTARRTAGRAFW